MTFWKTIRWRLFLPMFHLAIEIPFLWIRTAVMNYRAEMMEGEYIVLQIHFIKWKFEFRLYDTCRRIVERENQK